MAAQPADVNDGRKRDGEPLDPSCIIDAPVQIPSPPMCLMTSHASPADFSRRWGHHDEADIIRRRGSWRILETVEFATLEWVGLVQSPAHLLEPIGNIPPAKPESRYYACYCAYYDIQMNLENSRKRDLA